MASTQEEEEKRGGGRLLSLRPIINYNINKIDEAASSGQGQLLKTATVLWGGAG